MIVISIIIIFAVSFILALRSVRKELSIPEEVKHIRIKKKLFARGVILFLKEKVIHFR